MEENQQLLSLLHLEGSGQSKRKGTAAQTICHYFEGHCIVITTAVSVVIPTLVVVGSKLSEGYVTIETTVTDFAFFCMTGWSFLR